MKLKSHKELVVWQKSMDLVVLIYELTSKFPKSELFGITSQMRRASVSIPSNIAEGWGRKSSKEYQQFMSIAYGSTLELETQLILSKRLKLAEEQDFEKAEAVLLEVLKMLNSMTNKSRRQLLDPSLLDPNLNGKIKTHLYTV